MSDKDAFRERERGLEESYFQKRERELIEKQREKVALERARQKLYEKTVITNDEIIEALEDLGYNHETVRLLHLMPVIYIAWADGRMKTKERKMILEVARLAGIAEGSEADARLTSLLETAPSEETWEASFLAIQAVLRVSSSEQTERIRRDVLSYSDDIASLSKGLFGLDLLASGTEKAALERVVKELASHESKAAKEWEERLKA